MRLLKKITMVMLSGLIVLSGGCIVVSLHPLYTGEDIVFKPELVGTWRPKGENEAVWIFEKKDDGKYHLFITGDKSTGKFDACLVRLGKYMFLDIFPGEPEGGNDWYNLHLLPAHSFMKVSFEGDVLRMALLDQDWLEKQIEAGTVDIKYEITGDSRILLTAPTRELRAFVLKYADDDDAFELDDLYRIKEDAGKTPE